MHDHRDHGATPTDPQTACHHQTVRSCSPGDRTTARREADQHHASHRDSRMCLHCDRELGNLLGGHCGRPENSLARVRVSLLDSRQRQCCAIGEEEGPQHRRLLHSFDILLVVSHGADHCVHEKRGAKTATRGFLTKATGERTDGQPRAREGPSPDQW